MGVTIRQAMQQVADYPNRVDDELIQAPAHELVCRRLFDIANRPDAGERGSLARANKARRMILDRLVGKRRAGSHPATRTKVEVTFVDLTGGEISGTTDGVQPAAGRDDASGEPE